MHVHLPKPLHGWREFIGEIGIILIGVLLALGAESLIEDLGWRNQVGMAEEGLNQELGAFGETSYERLVLQPCVSARLSGLGEKLRVSTGEWKGAPLGSNTRGRALLSAYRMPNRPLVVDSWENAKATGTLNHIPRERVLRMAMIYSQARQYHELQEEEGRSAARLMPLAYDAELTPDTRLSMLATLGDLDRINSLMTAIARQTIEQVRSLHLPLSSSELETDRHRLLAADREALGQCVADLPLRL